MPPCAPLRRWRYAACVCRRWRALCASAQLLRDVNVCVDFNRRYDAQPRLLPYMHSVFDWLHMHAAPHAQRLRLGFEGILGHSDDDDDDDDVGRPTLAEEKAAKALLTRALTGLLGAACASGRLQELTVELRWTSVSLSLRSRALPSVMGANLCVGWGGVFGCVVSPQRTMRLTVTMTQPSPSFAGATGLLAAVCSWDAAWPAHLPER